jgi:undecaprenyl-diphosphatase
MATFFRPRPVPGRELLPRPAHTRVAAFDARVDRAFDHLRGNPVADRVFYAASALGDHGLIWLLVGAARGLTSERRGREAIRLGVALGAESALVNGVVKSLFRRTRPVWDQARPHALRRPRTSSFPSGHASSGFMAAGLMSEHDRARPLYYALAAVVASSRIYVRIHHASDVVAGAALGAALARVFRRAWRVR